MTVRWLHEVDAPDVEPQRPGESNHDYNTRIARAMTPYLTGYTVGARVQFPDIESWRGTIVRIWPGWPWLNTTVVRMDDDAWGIGGQESMTVMLRLGLVLDDAPVQLDLFGGQP